LTFNNHFTLGWPDKSVIHVKPGHTQLLAIKILYLD
jgi:hypothetical protein